MTTTAPHDPAVLMGELSRSARGAPEAYLAAARTTLESLVARPDLLDGVTLARKPGGYTRNLLFGDGELSIWAMVWSPGSKTSIHDHHCSCCFGLVTGSLREIRFRAISETQAVVTGEAERAAGFVACLLPSGPNLHQMVNDGPDEAISIHVYGYDHEVHATSVDREYQVAIG